MDLLKTVFWEMPSDMWQEGFFGKLLLLLWSGLILVVLGLLSLLLFVAIDGAFLDYKEGSGVVIEKVFTPAYDEYYLENQQVGTTIMMIPKVRHYNNAYVLTVTKFGLTGKLEVNKGYYEEIKVHDNIDLKYSLTRFSKSIVFKSK